MEGNSVSNDPVQAFFDELTSRANNVEEDNDSEAWRREFLINPVLTSPFGLDFYPWNIACEVSYRLTPAQRKEIRVKFGKDLVRVRLDYVLFPETPDTTSLVVEAKKKTSSDDLIKAHEAQVLIEQMISRCPWAILTDGEHWFLFFERQPLFCCNSLKDLGNEISEWRSLVGRVALLKQKKELSRLVCLLGSDSRPLSGPIPDNNTKGLLEHSFPGLKNSRFQVLAPPSCTYNSFAAVAGDRGRWWWPGVDTFWPKSAPLEESLTAFRETYCSLGFEEASHVAREAGIEKIAIFARGNEPTHASRQTETGLWVSKLGRNCEILHVLNDLEGDLFGEPNVILHRKKE
jgi:hypothetical protein